MEWLPWSHCNQGDLIKVKERYCVNIFLGLVILRANLSQISKLFSDSLLVQDRLLLPLATPCTPFEQEIMRDKLFLCCAKYYFRLLAFISTVKTNPSPSPALILLLLPLPWSTHIQSSTSIYISFVVPRLRWWAIIHNKILHTMKRKRKTDTTFLHTEYGSYFQVLTIRSDIKGAVYG